MIPLQLRLSGFLSYRDPIELDFTGFDLACISGQNGAGKSSLLDAMTWALFGQARRRDDALINTHSTAAEARLDFAYEGNVYRVQRSKPREKATMLEFFIQLNGNGQQGWKPLTERSVRETEAVIQSTLRMDYETFTNASFFLQGKADQFATQKPSDRKRILSSILGLEVWEEYREKATEQRKILENNCRKLDGQLEEINHELGEEPARRARLEELEASLASLAEARQAQETAVESLRQLATSLARQRELTEALELQLRSDRQSLHSLQTRLSERQTEQAETARVLENAAEIEAAYAGWQAARTELERWDGVAARFRAGETRRSGPLMEIEAARLELEQERRTLAARRAAVEAGLAERDQMAGQVSALEADMALVNIRLARRSEVENSLRELATGQADARAENPRLRAEMDELKERIATLQKSAGAACPLCGQPLSPAERAALVETLTARGKTLGDTFRANQALMKEFETQKAALEGELRSLASADADLRALSRQLDSLHLRQQAVAQLESDWVANEAPRAAEIDRRLSEEDYAAAARAVLAEIDAELEAMGYAAAEHDAARRREQAGRASENALRDLEVARARLAPLERETGELCQQVERLAEQVNRQAAEWEAAVEATRAAEANLPNLTEAERRLYALRERENRDRMDVGAARQKVAVLDDLRERQRELNRRRTSLTQEISRHKTLERAFGKDGVPALLIEQALPEIEAETNVLLDRLSNGSMSVSFQTQREYKDKARADMKETLDILISDGAGTRDYELFSGGEAFRVNFAIRLALSRVLAQRAGARLQTLVIDEGFGSQDALGRQRLIEAINTVRADFAKILVITHMEELKDYFPTRIEVEKTPRGSTVRVV